MGATVSMILKVLVFSIIAIVLYNLLKVFVISKIKANLPIKIASTIVSIILLVLSAVLASKFKEDSWQYYIGTAVVLLSLLTTVDFWVGDKNKRIRNAKNDTKNDNSMKPRPKAKPNRVKNRKNL